MTLRLCGGFIIDPWDKPAADGDLGETLVVATRPLRDIAKECSNFFELKSLGEGAARAEASNLIVGYSLCIGDDRRIDCG